MLVKLDGVDAGEALAMVSSHKLLAGRVSAEVDLSAGGTGAADVLRSLTG